MKYYLINSEILESSHQLFLNTWAHRGLKPRPGCGVCSGMSVLLFGGPGVGRRVVIYNHLIHPPKALKISS